MTRSILEIAGALLCAALAVCACALSVKTYAVLEAVQATTQALPSALDAALTREAARLDGRLQSIERRADGRLAAIQRDLVGEVKTAREDLTFHSATLIDLTNRRSLDVTRSLDVNLRAATSSLSTTLEAYAAIPATVGARLDPWTDCRKGTCLQAQAMGMIGTFRATGAEAARVGRVAREAAPSIVKDFGQTTANVERITRPEGWKWKAIRLIAPFAAGYATGRR